MIVLTAKGRTGYNICMTSQKTKTKNAHGWDDAPDVARLLRANDRRRKKTTNEAAVLRDISAWLKAAHIRFWRNNTQGNIKWKAQGEAFLVPTSRKGSPDLEGQLSDGRYFCIEVKRPGWKAPREPKTVWTPQSSTWKTYARHKQQSAWLEDTEKLGGVGFFATSVDEVKARLWAHAHKTNP